MDEMKLTVPYTKTKGYNMAYNQYTGEEISTLYELVEDANKIILEDKKRIRYLENELKNLKEGYNDK